MTEATLGARFQGHAGRSRLIEALKENRMVAGNEAMANTLAANMEVLDVPSGETLIEQDAADTDIFFIISGKFNIVVNRRLVGERVTGDHVGEMSAIQPNLPRAASVIATENAVVGKISETVFQEFAKTYLDVWRYLAKELARRLHQRNAQVSAARDKITIFIISSREAIEIARAVQNAFEQDDFIVIPWNEGVFKAGTYTIEALERQLEIADFAIAIAQPDDLVEVRGKSHSVPRDNVTFELGFFMGRLGRNRAILLEPSGEDVKLPSDLQGITAVKYKFSGDNLEAAIAPACNRLRAHFKKHGPM